MGKQRFNPSNDPVATHVRSVTGQRGAARLIWPVAAAFAVIASSAWADTPDAATAAATPDAAADDGALQTVVVTATHRREDVKDIPTSVSALDSSALTDHHVTSFDDLTRAVPGISFQAGPGPGLDNIAIRGVSSTSGSATVGIYVDDVSVTVRNTYDGAVQPKLFDIDRVEILRGPQGTLFGASSMGGTLRFITNKPDLYTSSIDGSVDVSNTDHGALNNETRAVANFAVVPGTFGIRVGAETTYQSGWINHYTPTATGNGVGTDGNPLSLYTNDSTGVLSNSHANEVITDVARVSAKYQTDGGLTLLPEVLYQHTRAGDSSLYFLSIGRFAQDKHVAEPEDDKLFVPSLTVTQDLGSLELTSVTSYFRRSFLRTQDGTLYNSSIFANYLLPPALLGQQPPGAPYQAPPTVAQLAEAANIIGFTPSPVVYNTITNQISEELRLTSSTPIDIGVPMHWQAGVYLTSQRQSHIDDEHIPGLQANFQSIFGYSIYDSYIGSAAIPGVTYANDLIYNAVSHYTERQIAPFGEVTLELTPDLKATAGLRYVSAKADYNFVAAGYFTIGMPTPYAESAKYSATTPKLALDYAINADMNVYTNVAKGFRLGGPTGPDPANVPGGSCNTDYQNLGIPGAPLKFDSDSLWSYEVGTKGRYFDNRLAINAAGYMIKWNNIQQTIVLPICGFAFTTNAGDASVFGSELEVRARVTNNWSVNFNAGTTHAYITKTLVPGIVGVGEDVLSVPKVNATLSTDYTLPVSDNRSVFIRSDYPWVGQSHAYFAATTVPFHENPSYGVLDASVGVIQKNLGSDARTLTVSLYAKNLLASNKIIQYPSVFQVEEAYTVPPLTFGFTVALSH
jgi:outer membrane receptor protein involved in Fe transport